MPLSSNLGDPRLEKFKWLPQGHADSDCRSQNSKAVPSPEHVVITFTLHTEILFISDSRQGWTESRAQKESEMCLSDLRVLFSRWLRLLSSAHSFRAHSLQKL
ncbi:hypothetical protein MG293_007948 [Ovis ammon polii]|uniref:Uncharacterized protein n=1 Tax=Ovis ammon polii TaxID=230172 RepID=A0AAD4UE54_OVIAM|nr:hypothetical protein MG293_007948 [Ovis ammon polii]